MYSLLRPLRFLALALSLTLLPLSAILAQKPAAKESAPPETKFNIAGTIVNALDGSPLAQARVSIVDAGNRANPVSMITSENGRFEFSQLKAGKFALRGAKRGFLTAAYDQHEQFSTAIVTGAGVDTENLVLRLMPLALLSGKILDEAGEPVRHANVSLYFEDRRFGMNRVTRAANASTDDQGSYEFASLAPGNYFVSVSARPWYAVHPVSSVDAAAKPALMVAPYLDVAYPTTYYNGATEAEAATPISLKGGDHFQVDIHLNPVPALHLIFHFSGDGKHGFNAPRFEKRVFDSEEYVQADGIQQVAPGVYELTGIPAGKYLVNRSERNTGQLAQWGELELLKSGDELDNTPTRPAARVKLSLQLPRGEPLPKPLYIELQHAQLLFVGSQSVNATGEVIFEEVPGGKYSLIAFSPGKPLSVARISSQGVETPGHDLTIAEGASLDLTVSLVAGQVTVEGFVKRGDRPMAGAMVILVPKDHQSHLDMFRRDQTDLDGSFAVRAVFPGVYTIVAVEDAWGFEWMQPAVLARYVKHGQNLTIGEHMQGSVHLPDTLEVQPR